MNKLTDLERKRMCSEKEPFATQASAQRQVDEQWRLFRLEYRYYECPVCYRWHLSKVRH